MFYEMFKVMILDILGIKPAPSATPSKTADTAWADSHESGTNTAHTGVHGVYPIVGSDGVYGSEIL